jgi:aminoglycoside phosphotransferase (APT) family kinase protein
MCIRDRLWIQPLIYAPFEAPGERLATIWPRVTVLATIDRPPWGDVGTLLAKLHRLPIRDDPPRLGGHTRLRLAVDYLRTDGGPQLQWLVERGEELSDLLAEPTQITLAHGDFHLGQLGHTPLRRAWKLLDVDDFGTGDPSWDLSSPAAYWAAGLLDDEAWIEFLDAYREAGGPAVPPDGDPWPALNLPAQAAMVIAVTQHLRAAGSVAGAESLLVAARRLWDQS